MEQNIKKLNTTVITLIIVFIIVSAFVISIIYNKYQKKSAFEIRKENSNFEVNLKITIADDLIDIIHKNKSKDNYKLEVVSSRNSKIKYQIEYSNTVYFHMKDKNYGRENKRYTSHRVKNCNINCIDDNLSFFNVFVDYSRIEIPSHLNNPKLEYEISEDVAKTLASTNTDKVIGLTHIELKHKVKMYSSFKFNNTSLDPCSVGGTSEDGKYAMYNLLLKNNI